MFVAMPRRHAMILLLAFAASILLRWPLINRPLSGHHELCTALVLIVLHNWRSDGFIAHHGAPAITYTGPADLIPPGYTEAPALHDGVLYYLSHPPLAYDLPHALFFALDAAPSALGLQLFNLFFHLTTALAIYLVARELLPSRSDTHAHSIPLVAGLLYLFMPAPLWFHGNAYMSDMFVQNAWAWHLLVALRAVRSEDGIAWGAAAWCAVTLFITTMISWPGVWAGCALGFVGVLRWRQLRDATQLRLLLAAVPGVSLALLFTAWRWMQVVDADALLSYFSGRYAERGSTDLPLSLAQALATLALNYRISWLPLLPALILCTWSWHRTRSGLRRFTPFLLLAGIPSLLEHLFLLDYTLHDFTALKAGVLLCVLAAIGIGSLPRGWANGLLTVTCIAGVLYFYRTNPIASKALPRFTQPMEQGLAIASDARKEEMVFTLGFTPEPQVQWYAKRTLFRIDDPARAHALMHAAGVKDGVIFRDAGGRLSAERISLR